MVVEEREGVPAEVAPVVRPGVLPEARPPVALVALDPVVAVVPELDLALFLILAAVDEGLHLGLVGPGVLHRPVRLLLHPPVDGPRRDIATPAAIDAGVFRFDEWRSHQRSPPPRGGR